MDFKAALTRKIGPLPVWAYGLAVVVGAWVWFYLKGSDGETEGTGPASGFPDVSISDSGLVDEAGTNAGYGSGGNNVVPGSSAPSSNQAWYQLSATYLVGFSYDGVTVANALTKYLSGLALTVTERALVSQAIARYGVPPEGVPPSTGGDIPNTPGRPGTPLPPRPRPPIAISPMPTGSYSGAYTGTAVRPR